MKILLAALLLTIVAQFPSCGGVGIQSGDIVGFVDDKYLLGTEAGHPVPVIVIGATEYQVPIDFWRQVHINDLVKFSNGVWTIVKKART